MSPRRRLPPGAIAGIVAGAIALAAFAGAIIGRVSSSRAEGERRAIQRYENTIEPLGKEGGRIVQQDIKPRLTELREGKVTPDQFRREAQRWRTDFVRIRGAFASAPRPDSLDGVAKIYDDALATYIEAIDWWIAASKLPTPAERNASISKGADIAERADRLYDRARARLAKRMKDAGLQPDATL